MDNLQYSSLLGLPKEITNSEEKTKNKQTNKIKYMQITYYRNTFSFANS